MKRTNVRTANLPSLTERLALFALALAAGFMLAGCGKANGDSAGKEAKDAVPAVPVEVAATKRAEMAAIYSGTAPIESERKAFVMPKVKGEIRAVLADEGQRVREGQTLARLDGDQLRLEVALYEATMRKLERDYARNVELQGKGLISATAIDNLKYELEAAKANWDLARLQLSRFLGGDPRAWPLVTNRYGRPELASPVPPPLGFNVSHTPGLVACAVTATPDVGVDVELVRRRLTHDVAERFFAPREVADLRRLSDADQARVFFDYWTLKEAYIKARGMGLALPLAHFAFALRPPAAPTISFDPEIDDDPATWQFAQSWPTDEHRLGLAVRRPPGRDLDVRIEAVVPRVPA